MSTYHLRPRAMSHKSKCLFTFLAVVKIQCMEMYFSWCVSEHGRMLNSLASYRPRTPPPLSNTERCVRALDKNSTQKQQVVGSVFVMNFGGFFLQLTE